MTSSRFIRARVVSAPEFAGEVAGPRVSAKQRQIRRKLRRARALKRRIAHLSIRKPLGWKGAVKQAKVNLRVVMSDLRALGWKPKKPSRPRRPGEDEMDAALEDIPAAEPGEQEMDDAELDAPEEAAEPAETEGEPNWLDRHVGAEPKRPVRDLLNRAGKLFTPKWTKPVPLGDGAQIATRPGQRAMVATVSPGLFIVQLVSDEAARKVAGDNIGVLPLVLYPLVKSRILQKLTQPAPPAQPAPATAPAAPTPAPVGCEPCRPRS